MRRRRKPLEVSTFPFLAVLLCAMGSLILVLLVMDRKAKMGARQKAIAAMSHAADEAERTAAARRAELERHLQEKRAEQQAEWEKKRDALHTKLLTEQQALQLQMQQLRDKITLAAARLRLEQEQSGDLKMKAASERAEVQSATQALAATKQTVADTQTHTEQEKAALARMTNDLVVLERALQDLKETRERERQTYSVVPYNGKRGESRRPLYIECAGDHAIFHPDKKAVLVLEHSDEIRNEVARRVAGQREQLAAAKMPVDQTPYLMLLVRPDGIYSYYAFQAALAGLDVQFGYELIDADWLLDFPEENKPGTQAWQALAKTPQLPPLDPPVPSDAKVHGVQFHKTGPLLQAGAPGSGGNTTNGSGGPGDRLGGSGARSDNPLSPGELKRPVAWANSSGTDQGTTGAVNVSGGTGPPQSPWEAFASGAPLPGQTPLRGYRGNYPGEAMLALGQNGTGSLVPGSGANGASGGGNRDANGAMLPDWPPGPQLLGDAPGGGGAGIMPAWPPEPQLLAQRGSAPSGPATGGAVNPANSGLQNGNSGTGPSIATRSQTPAQGNAPPQSRFPNTNPGDNCAVPLSANRVPNATLPPLTPGAASGVASGPTGNSFNQGGGSPGGGSSGGGGSSSANGAPGGGTNQGNGQPASPGGSGAGGQPAISATASGESGGAPGEGQPPSILGPAHLGGRPAKQPPPQMHAARLSGDRDYVIFLECRPDSVVLYPAQREFPLTSLSGGPNDPLVQAVRQMIDRRQSGVRPGDVPYRPQIRFLVRPQTLRAYHTVYPLLEALPATKTRQNLIPEDNVRAIIGGN